MAKRHFDCPWLIIDLVAMRRGNTIYVSCKVLNPAPGELLIEVAGDFEGADEVVILPSPNCPIPFPEMFAFPGIKGSAYVYGALYDEDGNLEYETTPVPVGEARSKVKTPPSPPAKAKK